MAKRRYKRDKNGRFKGGGGGSSGGSKRAPGARRAKAVALTKKVARSPLTYQIAGTIAIGVVANRDAASFASAMGSARTAAYNRNAAANGITAGSAMLKAAKQRGGVYRL